MFTYLCLRKRECKWERGRERGREKISSRLRTISMEPDVGLEIGRASCRERVCLYV